MFPQPLSSATVPVLSEKKTNSDQTPPDKPYEALSKPSNCLVSARARACQALCVSLSMLEDYFEPLMHMSIYLQSRNASTPASRSRRMRQTTAAVVPLPSVSHGAAIQE